MPGHTHWLWGSQRNFWSKCLGATRTLNCDGHGLHALSVRPVVHSSLRELRRRCCNKTLLPFLFLIVHVFLAIVISRIYGDAATIQYIKPRKTHQISDFGRCSRSRHFLCCRFGVSRRPFVRQHSVLLESICLFHRPICRMFIVVRENLLEVL